jgi:Big-like domain-containing protein
MRMTKSNIPVNRSKFPSKTFIMLLTLNLLIASSMMTVIVKADDLIVDDDGSGTYLSIQDAIDAANPGDTIWVKDGSYSEALTISTENIKIIADNGAEPILYLTSYPIGISIQASNIILEGFKIYGNDDFGGGPVIQLTSGADQVIIRDNTFTVISEERGNTAILIESGAINNQFKDNTVKDYHIGVELEDATLVIATGNSFTNVNYTIYHGASVQGTYRWHGTIQDAVDEASVGSTVNIVAGPFTENILINKSLHLYGAQVDQSPLNGRDGEETSIDGGTTSTIQIMEKTEDVIISGLTILMSSKDGSSNQAGILIHPSVSNVNIEYNIFDGITDGSGADTVSDETSAIMIYGLNNTTGGQTNIDIEYNLIQNIEEYGIIIKENTSFVTIKNNKIIELIGSNHASDSYPPWEPSWPDLITSAICLGGEVGPIHNITIEDNILMTNNTGDGTLSTAGCGISFMGVAEWSGGSRPWINFTDITIEDNIISQNSIGIIGLGGQGNNSIEVHDSNLSGNSVFAVQNLVQTLHINATDDWWGNITGPYNATENLEGTGDNVTGNVTFWPWYEFDGYSIPPTVDYDVEGPQINAGEVIRESTEIELNADDNESGMLSLTYRIWNTTHRWGPWINYTEPFSLNSQGNHRVQYNATDNAGTSTYYGPFVYTEHRVDDGIPFVEVIYPNGGEFEFDTIPIEWVAADEIYDQGQLGVNGSIPLTEDYPGHIQSFVPTEDEIDSVHILINGDDANISVKLFSSISPVPTLIGQSVRHLEDIGTDSNPDWVTFPFGSTINLDTTKTYYIGVTQTIYGDTGFKWHYFDDITFERYPYGHAWIKETDALTNMSTMDFAFKTMYWKTDVDITVQYSNMGVSPWSTIADGEINDGIYNWDTASYGIPDGPNYRINILATDMISNIGSDYSDEKFIIDNEGPSVYNIVVTDTTIESSLYTKNGDNIEVTAQIGGDPEEITADLSSFGKGTEVPPTSFTGGTAKWTITDIICSPPDGQVTARVTAEDSTGDSESGTGSIRSDNTNPEIIINKPGPGLYLMDSMRLLPFAYPFIIGQITFEVDASDNGSGISQVQFYLENDLEETVSSAPYNWLWDRAATGFFDVEIIALDQVGHTTSDEVRDLFIINLDIIGHD